MEAPSEAGSATTMKAAWFARASGGLLAFLLPLAATGLAEAQPRPGKIVLAAVAGARDAEVSIRVLREAYSKVGIEVEIQRHPGEIALRKSRAGEVAGEVHRIDGVDIQFPELVQVPVPINFIDFAIFSRLPEFKPESWFDLARRQVGILRGVVAVEQATRDLNTRAVDTYAELFSLLVRGEVDAVAVPMVVGLDAMKRLPKDSGIVTNAILDSYVLYHYLHRSHAQLVPVIEPVLREMLRDGTTSRIRAETYADLPRPVFGTQR